MSLSLPARAIVFFFIGLFLAVSPAAASATTRRVPADYPMIHQAIDAAVDGDTVLVAPGTYVEHISFHGKAISVISEAGPEVTTINSESPISSVVTFASGEGPGSMLQGFTVQNGGAALFNYIGGGIFVDASSPKIIGNIIRNNQANYGGGGIGITGNASPLIQGNTITNNQHNAGGIYPGGGGIGVEGGASPQVLDNIISDNSSPTYGGGISLYMAGQAVIRNNKICRNSGHYGGGASVTYSYSSAPRIIQNLIADNLDDFGSGIGGGLYAIESNLVLLNNTIANNASYYSGVVLGLRLTTYELTNNIIVAKPGTVAVRCGPQSAPVLPIFRNNNVFSPEGIAYAGSYPDQTGMNGNISADPLFVNPAAGDYHLRPGSPSID
nr:right-handed parallel beta-helix repeat-containing protein [Acidobacteriota bacterium]